MSSSSMILHRGATEISRNDLDSIQAPTGTHTWFPVSHGEVLNAVESRIVDSGFQIAKARYAVTADDLRMFSTLDLAWPVAEGVSLSVGVRNSNDKSFPLGMVAGNRVFVCDNLAFRSELMVSRRHTRFGEVRFGEAISLAVRKLSSFQEVETRRISLMQNHELGDEQADSLILRAFEKDVVSARLLPTVVKEWREPSHDDFAPRTMWSLLNAFTEALKARLSQPQIYAAKTVELQGLLCTDARYSVSV